LVLVAQEVWVFKILAITVFLIPLLQQAEKKESLAVKLLAVLVEVAAVLD
jgi:hypothetical protein